MLRRAAVVAAVRTPFGRYGGSLSSVRPDDLAAHAIRAVVAKAGIDPALVEEVVFGAANQSGEDNRNVARMAALHHPYSMGETAEHVARAYRISREDQDRFALESQRRWAAAHAAGRFADELVPVEIPQGKRAPLVVSTDEHPRPDTTAESLAALKPVFVTDGTGTVTAGNASGINDGAAALLVVEESRAAALGLAPLAFVGPSASAGVDPAQMGIGPVPAIRKLIERTGHAVDSVELFEINEAFAAQTVACVRELGLDPARVNVNGGAIAIGHPLGASGARLATTLIHEMRRRGARSGIASLCVGVGQGLATLFTRD
jgi:acetyl-CoA acetyltransferase family protein